MKERDNFKAKDPTQDKAQSNSALETSAAMTSAVAESNHASSALEYPMEMPGLERNAGAGYTSDAVQTNSTGNASNANYTSDTSQNDYASDVSYANINDASDASDANIDNTLNNDMVKDYENAEAESSMAMSNYKHTGYPNPEYELPSDTIS